jgi:DNA-directed RNA polymerase specialized sigma24 family protein
VGPCEKADKAVQSPRDDVRADSAVYTLLRISRAITALRTRLRSLLLVEYFVDFTQEESAATGDSAQISFE